MFSLDLFRPRAAGAARPAAGACFHCGLPLPDPVADEVEFEGARRALCCAACRAAAELLIGSGCGAYYRRRAERRS